MTVPALTRRDSASDYLYILGVPNFANYEAAAALIKVPRGGGPIEYVCIGEDRLTRIKHTYLFPLRGIDYCLRHFGLESLDQVDYVATDFARIPRWLNSGPGYRKLEHDYLKVNLRFPRERIIVIDHHDAHAASCFYPSGFDEAGVLVVDGMGSELETQSAYHFRGDNITWRERGYDWGVSRLYSLVTGTVLPYGPEKGYGKVMGLAPYGADAPPNALSFNVRDSGMTSDYSGFFSRFPISRLVQQDVPQCSNRESVMQHPFPRAAFEVQQECERQMVRLARYIHQKTGTRRLCISGGVGLNGRANYEILRQTPIEEIWVQPGCSDTGIPFGLTLWAYYEIVGPLHSAQRATVSMPHAYCGTAYRDDEIEAVLRKYRIKHWPTTAGEIASWLAEGQIVAVFEGASEFGPRALGHRSILADPRRSEMKDKLNASVKMREGYRPYAPVVLRDRVSEYFEFHDDSPFMLIVADVRPDKEGVIPAVTHVDSTARIQTVTQEHNGFYYEVVKAFDELTGVPVLLNTSFNINREPIVETPLDALICAFGTGIDRLVMEGRSIDCSEYQDIQLVKRLEQDRRDYLDTQYQELVRRYLYDYNPEEMAQFLREENAIAEWYRDYRAKYELEKLMTGWKAEQRRVLIVGTPGHTACLMLYIPEFPSVNVVGLVSWPGPGEAGEIDGAFKEFSPDSVNWEHVDEVLVSSHEYQREICDWLEKAAPGVAVRTVYDSACDSLLYVLPQRWPVMNPEVARRHRLSTGKGGLQRTASNIDFDFEPAKIEISDRHAAIINYHDIRRQQPGPYPLGALVRPEQLMGQIERLRDKFEFARARDLVDPESQLSESSIVLTFDDGLIGVFAHAFRVMQGLAIPGTVYVCALPYVEKRLLNVQKIQLLLRHLGLERFRAIFYEELDRRYPRGVDRDSLDYAGGYQFYRYDTAEVRKFKLDLNYRVSTRQLGPVLDTMFRSCFGQDAEAEAAKAIYLGIDDLKRLVDAGWEIGVHGYDHAVLPRLTLEEQRWNLSEGFRFVSPITGENAGTVAYPFGFANNATRRVLKEVGALAGFTMGRRIANPQDLQNRWDIPRFDVNDCFGKTGDELRAEVFASLAGGD
jgi:carbamoyltransferase